MLRIAGPTVATMSSYTAMTFSDKWLCSLIGPEPIYVGAQGNGGLASWVPISLAYGLLNVINPFVAQNMGAGKPERGPAYVWNGLWLGLLYWALLLVPYSFAVPWVLRSAGVDEAQATLGAEYGRILLWGAGINLSTRAVGHFFYGMHRAGVVMVAGVSANLVNLALSAVLIFGPDPAAQLGSPGEWAAWVARLLHIPAMGVAGSAWGTVIATVVELAIPAAVFLGPKMNRALRTRAAWRPSAAHIRDLLRVGWPQAAMFGNEMICWGYFMVHLVSHFGVHHATAGWIAHQYMSLSFMPAVGLSVACSALVGKYQGMNRSDLAARRAWLTVASAIVYMGLCAVAFVVFREPLVRLFIRSDTPPEAARTLVTLGGQFMIATAAFQLFDAVAMTISGALRGAGDTLVPGLATVALAWTVLVAGGTALTHLAPSLESLGAWVAAASYIALLCVFVLVRFLGGSWRKIRLVKSEPPIPA